MSVSLAFKHNGWGQAFVAHALGEGLVIGAVVIHFVAELKDGCAVLALLVWLVLSLALGLHLGEVVLEALVLELRLGVLHRKTVGAFFVRAVGALMLDFFG